MTAEQRRILESKPIWRMRRFAAFLNWHGLELSHHILSAEDIARLNFHPSGIVVHYRTPDWKFNLHINKHPIGQALTYQATVTAIRYGIVHIGWHDFTLFEDDDDLKREAERLRPRLDRNLYKNKSWRREFKARPPEQCRGRK